MRWKDVSYVISSRTRRAILMRLEKEKTPTLLALELHLSLPNVSRGLLELEAKGLVEMITPGTRVGKIYRATEDGKAVARDIRKMTGEEGSPENRLGSSH